MKSTVLWTTGLMLLGGGTLAAQQGGPEDPLGELTVDMKVVVARLKVPQTGKPTQEKQKEVVAKLDALIAELEKECAACRGGTSGNRPTKPLADSVIIGGTGGIGDLHAAKQSGKKWGELPAKERDRILQSMTEGFPAHYQNILERYYRRLAEEKPAADAAPAGKPAAAPVTAPAPSTGASPAASATSKPAGKLPASGGAR